MDFNTNKNITPELILNYIKNNVSIEQNPRIIEWLKDPKNKKDFIDVYYAWQSTQFFNSNSLYNTNEAWHKLKESIPHHQRRRKPTNILNFRRNLVTPILIAASLLIFFILGIGIKAKVSLFSSRPLQYVEYTVPYCSMSKIMLPDSSFVWLNAGSTIKYNSDFGFSNRDIILSGEAFFDVTPNEKLAFEVFVKKYKFRAVGTSFNIKSYEEDGFIEATVEEGKIDLELINENKKQKKITRVNAREKLIITNKPTSHKDSEEITTSINKPIKPIYSKQKSKNDNFKIISNFKTEISTSWKDEKWILESERFENFANMLQRRYNVKIVFADESLKDFTFTGAVKNETIEQMMEAIYLTTPIDYEIDSNTILLKRNKRDLK